ncbi:glycosyl hydrolase 2 galactose-binding domain-containing protein [Pendulispora albinea]|uniref:Exo-1,4-beta-D-glucosaminidase n=1 Tax=Pendulispora albinea TaxID=2741071 RepID=A0ABZ2LY31_9BACT
MVSLAACGVVACVCVDGSTPKVEEKTVSSMEGALELSSGWQLQDVAKVADSGEAISQVGYVPSGWYRATVPGTVLTSLVNEGVYPEPLYGENNRPNKIPESLCRTSYWYRARFDVPRVAAGRHLWLNFEGINYTADVWVNGHAVGTIRGAFARGLFDVTAFVVPGEPAAVAVKMNPPPHPGDPEEHTIAQGMGLNGGVLAQDGPTFLCTIGWDWLPGIRDRDMGIWRKVTLSATGPVKIEDPAVTSDLPLPRTDEADLTVEATLRNVTGAPQTGVLRGALEGGAPFEQTVTLAPNEVRTIKLTSQTVPALHVLHPRLWWPNGYGPQNLNTLHLRFDARPFPLADAASGGAAAREEAPSDVRDVIFGIREISYHVTGTENLTLSVNGVKVIAKGGNWGMDEAMKRIPRDRLEAQIRMHQQAHYTMIRNWVGQSTSEDFYELCDKYGLLLWDEFFQPNPSDGPNPSDIGLYLANVREKVLRFRNHPSIALWCGRNEGDPAPAELDRGVQRIMSELDPQRLYQRNSADGRGVRSGGPYSWREPRKFYQFPQDEAFKTEIGSVSIPTLESVQAMMPEKDWNTINDDWAEHDLARGAQQGRDDPRMYADVLGKRYGQWANLGEFVRRAQLMNYEAYRAMYEGRFAKLFKPTTGVITWMSNPAQPSFVWQLYSHDLEPHASLFAVQKACEPVHIQMNQSDFHVMVINDGTQARPDLRAEMRVFNLDGTLKSTRRANVTAPPAAATDVGAMVWPSGLSAVHFVKLELRDGEGRLVSDNFYWRARPERPDDFTALTTLPTVAVGVTMTRREDGDKVLLDATVSNPTSTIALATHLQLRKRGTMARVLPVHYSDNYITLLPGESRTITVEAASKDLGDEEPWIAVDGWNVVRRPWIE